jgi:DNA-binding MarR family transcriptional regulator
LDDVREVVLAVRKTLDGRLYDTQFQRLTPREVGYVLALADLGSGPHAVNEVAERLGVRSDQVSSIRNQLVKKDILFAPNGGMVEFRIPLTDRYIAEHREVLERRARAKEAPAITARNTAPSTNSRSKNTASRDRGR